MAFLLFINLGTHYFGITIIILLVLKKNIYNNRLVLFLFFCVHFIYLLMDFNCSISVSYNIRKNYLMRPNILKLPNKKLKKIT